MAVRCVGGIEAVEYFESLPVPEGQAELHEHALNRIRYEAAKGIGAKPKVHKAIYRSFHDTETCGRCGCGIGDAWFKYCPSCGTAILRNPVTVKRLEEHQISIDEWMERGAYGEKDVIPSA